MATEIERKFLVTNDSWRNNAKVKLCQGYLNRDKSRTVRVRIAGEQAFITIKGATSGASRAEFEYPIPLADAEQMLLLCEGPVIEKYRYTFEQHGSVWEVDEFLGDNAGLVVAEIELESEQQTFTKPDWLGIEVTSDARYFNSSLSKNPYKNWA